MKLTKYIFSISIIALCSCHSVGEILEVKNNTPKNVILLIGDGTGLSQVSSAFYFKETAPNYGRFKHIGLINTSSSREDVTDSAAGATAFACGVKTYNGAIGVADDSTAVVSLVEIVSPLQIKTGVISTSSLTHATPASFLAHALSRNFDEEIAADMVETNIDFLAGGGIKFFNKRKDGRNLFDTLASKSFKIDTTALGDFESIKSSSKVAYILEEKHMPAIAKGRGDFLPNATELGIQFLNKNKSNFFLMVEGSQIDWGGHANDSDYLISELIDFDNAIGKALDFAKRDGNTLVIVTADHETGGFTLAAKTKTRENGKEYSDYSEVEGIFSTSGHSATLIPVFAYGPGAEEFMGVYQNNEIFHKILKVTNWKPNN
ncbi:alkaline phosphatase [Thalassobellus suaedae]|uniref:Alkaline phosphatase n=1 Tax=Thalassobellus suaedae TaxID=3074124 RepID=A0ABY9Y2P9_9FLAO|nr:alkaline phosphatase [Flavobacteriaceae bacterium HL-DH10]